MERSMLVKVSRLENKFNMFKNVFGKYPANKRGFQAGAQARDFEKHQFENPEIECFVQELMAFKGSV